MASANGSLTTSSHPAEPSSPADNFAHKRKRGDDAATVPNGIVAHPPSAPTPAAQTQRDLLEILQPYDTTPSFLRYELTDSNDTMTDEPSHKKARLTGESAAITIAGKLVNGAYTTLHGLKSDASHVSKAIETCLRVKAKENQGHLAGRLLVEDLKLLQRVKAFEELIKDVVEKEIDYEAMHRVSSDKNDEKNIVHDHNSRFDSRMNASSTVLTLFGNAPTPKQLFSSMQHHVPTSKTDSMVKSELPVEEMSLPNGITATKIMPAPTEEGKKAPTFDETFAPPYNLPALQPPKVHKRSSTRDNVITWEFKDPIYRGSKKGGYTVQTVTDGNWLGYGGVDSAADTLSQKEKRRQRDRALSSGAESVKEPPSKAALEEEQARQEEALFRRAYSSFAPSYDNAKAIIPVQTKANIWWQKVGERRYKEVSPMCLMLTKPGVHSLLLFDINVYRRFLAMMKLLLILFYSKSRSQSSRTILAGLSTIWRNLRMECQTLMSVGPRPTLTKSFARFQSFLRLWLHIREFVTPLFHRPIQSRARRSVQHQFWLQGSGSRTSLRRTKSPRIILCGVNWCISS